MPLDDSPAEKVYAIGVDVYDNGYYVSLTKPEGKTLKRVFWTRQQVGNFIETILADPSIKEFAS